MRNLQTHPAWEAQDLGHPLPDDPHAVSVALPLWEHVVRYEENDPAIIKALRTGYPRFFPHPSVCELTAQAERELAASGERAWLFASRKAAQRAGTFVGPAVRLQEWLGLHVMLTPDMERAKLAWRFFGEGISSRRAEAVLRQTPVRDALAVAAAQAIREDLARRSGQQAEDVYLFPSGMAAMAAAHRAVRMLRPGRPSLQFDFPYVDVLKVQKAAAPGATLFDGSHPRALDDWEPGAISAVFTEIVSNPQLRTPPLAELASRLRPSGVPLVSDDTIGTVANVDVYPYSDLVTTSLTKYYSGVGNVMAGSLILKRSSPLYPALRAALEEDYSADFFGEDAIVLASNARDFDARIRQINRTSEQLHEFLSSHPKVEVAWYPKGSWRELYDPIRRENGGYGGLLTFLVKSPARNAPAFYDGLRICKGPSLGTNFSLACPYMLLAHYNELAWTDQLGINRHLLRLSVGLEPAEELMERLEEALGNCVA